MTEQVGTVAEEAAKLFEALHTQNGTEQNGKAHTGPECQWCPLCQLYSLVRQARPETVEQVGHAVTGVLGSLRDLLDAATESVRAAREDRPEPEDQKKAERIDVSEDPEPWD
jgi:hypothetical protein